MVRDRLCGKDKPQIEALNQKVILQHFLVKMWAKPFCLFLFIFILFSTQLQRKRNFDYKLKKHR